MKKALAIFATVATIGATAVTAPAQARGIGPGLAFGLAAGALAAGAAASAYGPYYYGPGYGYTATRPTTIMVRGLTPLTAGRTTIGTATGAIIIGRR